MKKIITSLFLLASLVSLSQEAKLDSTQLQTSYDRSGTCASPDNVNRVIPSPPIDYNYLLNNGYCYTVSPAVKDFVGCYTMTAGATSINFNAGYNSTGCAGGLNINYARLYTTGTCVLVNNAALGTITGLVIGVNYTWCISLKCTGSGPGFSTFCPYYQNISPLPIELIDFQCDTKEDNITINWTTATEINNQEFQIWRSKDANSWNRIGTIPGAGNSSTMQVYQYVDYFPPVGDNYYKLIQMDYNGITTSSGIISCNYQESEDITIVYYNLVGQEVDIEEAAPGFYTKEYSLNKHYRREVYYKQQ